MRKMFQMMFFSLHKNLFMSKQLFCKFTKFNCYVVLVLYLQKHCPCSTTVFLKVGVLETILGVLDVSFP